MSPDQSAAPPESASAKPAARRLSSNSIVVLLVLFFLIAIVVVQWQRSRLMEQLIESAGIQAAKNHLDALATVRTVYTDEVVSVATDHGIEVTHDYKKNNKSIPLPATLTILIGDRIAAHGGGGRTRLYSPYPFKWREADGGLRDDFQKEAWEKLNADPETPVVRTMDSENGPVLRYAIADRMRPSCVQCHNEHRDSPRRGWQVGDVRGVLEIEVPLGRVEALARRNLLESSLLMGLVAVVGGGVFASVVFKFSRISTELDERVRERTAELERTNQALQAEVAERQRAENTLRVTDERLNLALQSSGVGTWNYNVVANSIIWDDYLHPLFGLKPGTFPGHLEDALAIIHIDDRERVGREVQATVMDDAPFDTEFQVVWPDGSVHWLGSRGKVYRDAAGRALTMTGVCWDITERNQLRDMVNQKEKLAAIGLLAAGIAHEVNNPLSTVANNLAVLQRDITALLAILDAYEGARTQLALVDPETSSRIQVLAEEADLPYVKGNLGSVLNRTRENVQRVAKIVSNLRNLGQTDAPRFTNVLFADLAELSLSMIRATADRLGITIVEDYEPELQIYGIAPQLSQVLVSLLANAVQAIESAHRSGDGLIRLTARRTRNEILVEIADNGCGIEAKDISRIFDPFYTTQPIGKGTGLGLALCQAIISGHNGRIGVDTQPGQGCCFRVHLPVQPRELHSSTNEPEA